MKPIKIWREFLRLFNIPPSPNIQCIYEIIVCASYVVLLKRHQIASIISKRHNNAFLFHNIMPFCSIALIRKAYQNLIFFSTHFDSGYPIKSFFLNQIQGVQNLFFKAALKTSSRATVRVRIAPSVLNWERIVHFERGLRRCLINSVISFVMCVFNNQKAR